MVTFSNIFRGKNLGIIGGLLWCALYSSVNVRAAEPAPPNDDVLLRAEFTKTEIYTGETVVVNFVLYSKDEMLEAEVAKFPEFRGFWSENTALRQGPLALIPESSTSPMKRVLVGTYVLVPMVGKDQPTVEPMKIMVRRPLSFNAEARTVHLSQPTPLKIKPLPPIPEGLRPYYGGAVGRFTFFAEPPAFPFQKDEPAGLRLVLQGEGNFQEVNEIPVSLPKEIELLSKKAFSQGTMQFPTKTFDFTLAIHAEHDVDVPPIPFVYFNPATKKYEQLFSTAIHFPFQPTIAAQSSPDRPVFQLGVPETTVSVRRPLLSSKIFWIFQALLATAFTFFGGRRFLRQSQRRKRHEEMGQTQRKRRVVQLRESYDSQNLEKFLHQADALVYDAVHRKLGLRHRPSHAEVIRQAEAKWGAQTSARVSEIFSSYESLAFSPKQRSPLDKEKLWEAVEEIMRRTAP